MAGARVCYDLCAMPKYIEPLRAEISELLKEDGGWGPTTPMKMRKMDSFGLGSVSLTKAQYLRYVSVDFHHLVQKPITLSDGIYLPMGTQLCTASYPISQDPNNIASPQDFDGFRYEKLRRKPDEENKHQFATTDMNHLHFGRGKYACPGRFFASAELKIILAHVIMQYDLKYLPGKGRPANLNAVEFMYPDPTARLLMKHRPRN